MKLSISLADETAHRLTGLAQTIAGGNASILIDLALKRLFSLPQDQLSTLVERHRLDRKAATRNGWSTAFWTVLGELMGRNDRIENPLGPRNYGRYYLVQLLNRVPGYDEEGDPFPIHIGPQMWTPDGPSDEMRFTFDRSRSPVAAAETVAEWLRPRLDSTVAA